MTIDIGRGKIHICALPRDARVAARGDQTIFDRGCSTRLPALHSLPPTAHDARLAHREPFA